MKIIELANKLNKLLTDKQRKILPVLLVLMVIASALEVISVSLVLPLMSIALDAENRVDKWYMKFLFNVLHFSSIREVMIVLSLLMAVIIIFKNIYIIWETRIVNRFVSRCRYASQRGLLESMLNRPYEFFMGVSSGKVLSMVTVHITQVFYMLSNIMLALSELLVMSVMILALFIMAPKLSLLTAIVLSVEVLLVTRVIKPYISKVSDDNNISAAEMNKWMMQSIQGIKEVKVMGAEDYFLANYDKSAKISAYASGDLNVLSTVPRTFIEAATMTAFFIGLAAYYYFGGNLIRQIPLLTTLAMAIVRLLPSANRVSSTVTNVTYSEPYLDELLEFIGKMDETSVVSGKTTENCVVSPICDDEIAIKIPSLNDCIRMEDVFYSYPNAENVVLDGASLEIKKGQSVGIVGSSGAGKTTVVDIILGFLIPRSGRVTVDGVDISVNRKGWLSQTGYIPQMIFLLDGSIRENVAFGIATEDVCDDEVWRALDEAALGDFVRTMPEGIETQVGERGMRLSGGQRQRIGIARALYRNPEVLFFDEATSALDNETETAIMESINGLKGRKTMIIIAHRLTTIDNCDHVYRVEDGRILKEQ